MKTAVTCLCAVSALAASLTGAAAQDYPTRAIRMVVPYAAGGPTDLAARKVAELLAPRLGQSVVIENQGGGGGIPGEIDLLNVFRRSEDIPKHTSEILSKKPKTVWFQLGIRNDEVAEQLAQAGIKVVQDMCLMVEHRALL